MATAEIVFVLFAEDHGLREAVERLTDRVLCEESAAGPRNWIDDGNVESLRRWQGAEPHEPYTPLSALDKVAKRMGVAPVHGHFGGTPGAADATLCRKALRVALSLPRCSAVVIARDRDGVRTVRGFEQAKAEREWPFALVLAAPEPEVEAWHAAGFVPADQPEMSRLIELRQRLGFDPTTAPHELRSTAKASPKDAKAVVDHLTAGSDERKRECLNTALKILRERGEGCGLNHFLDQAEQHLVALVRGREPERA